MKNPSTEPDWPVKIVRSNQRRKTVGARLEDGVLVIRAPASISDAELAPIIESLRKRMGRRARVVPQTDEMLEALPYRQVTVVFRVPIVVKFIA